ncbi:MAG TPA: diguanylate cyclase [Gammaproteobacteria bacterium]
MEFPKLDLESLRSPFADQLKRGFRTLQFDGLLEKEFRDFYVTQNLKRVRLSAWIALGVALALAGIEVLFGFESPDGDRLAALRFGVLCPLLLTVVIALSLPAAPRWYSTVAAAGLALVGLVVVYISHLAALQGHSYVLAGLVLVMLFACVFFGVVFKTAVAIGAFLVAAHVVLGLVLGLPPNELYYMTTILCASGVIGAIWSYQLEHTLRANFLETRLLNELAERDGLTGLYNRRIFDDFMQRLWRQSRREGAAVVLVFIDIDYFKIYNDLYGHQAGDDCLKRVANTIARCAKRPLDFVARYGGEEFMLVLYGPPEDYAHSLPEQIREDVMALGIAHEGSQVADRVTVSIGVAVAKPGTRRSLAGVIQTADEALYEAKRGGKNRVVYKDASESEVETGNFRAPTRQAG